MVRVLQPKSSPMSNIKDLDDTWHLEDATSEHSLVKVKTKEQVPDQISLTGNVSQSSILSVSDTTTSSMNTSHEKRNKSDRSHGAIQMLSPEKKSEIIAEQYNILKRKYLARKAKREEQLQHEKEEAIKEGQMLAKQCLAKELGCSVEDLEMEDEDFGFPLHSSGNENDIGLSATVVNLQPRNFVPMDLCWHMIGRTL